MNASETTHRHVTPSTTATYFLRHCDSVHRASLQAKILILFQLQRRSVLSPNSQKRSALEDGSLSCICCSIRIARLAYRRLVNATETTRWPFELAACCERGESASLRTKTRRTIPSPFDPVFGDGIRNHSIVKISLVDGIVLLNKGYVFNGRLLSCRKGSSVLHGEVFCASGELLTHLLRKSLHLTGAYWTIGTIEHLAPDSAAVSAVSRLRSATDQRHCVGSFAAKRAFRPKADCMKELLKQNRPFWPHLAFPARRCLCLCAISCAPLYHNPTDL